MWPKATVKSPVGARDLWPVQPPQMLSAFMFGFVARFTYIFSYLLLFIWPLPCRPGPAPCPALPCLAARFFESRFSEIRLSEPNPVFRIRLSGPVPPAH
jgi:hypothetical protein